ncbi:MAG: DNA primase [Candidatus Omnitrophota bacterium]|jgi:DNA primase
MAIPENLIDTIQERTDIVEVISRYVPLKKAGRNYKAPCPFHHEKTPSFVVSPDKQIYHCFGCGAGGNVFSFLMKFENLEFPEVIEMLAEKAGVVLPRSGSANKEMVTLANQLYKINDLAAQFFQSSLANNAQAKEYLSRRGIGDETAKKFRLGYAPDGWDGLLNFFKKNGIGPEILEKSGLVIPNDRGGHYDRFRHRIIFPIIDLKEKMLGFGGRVLDSSLPKYLNSPETAVYSKGRNLYGLNFSREAIKKEGFALVVEGYLDFIIPYQAGVNNLIATLGTALTPDQVKLLKRFAGTVIMVYDPDEAGEAASLRNMDIFISEDVNVYVAELPNGMDPDNCIQKLGTEEFLRIVKSAKNLFDYKLEKLSARFNIKTAHGKAGIASEMLPTLAKINNAVLKSSLIKKLAEKLSVDEDSIKSELKKVKPDYSARVAVAASPVPVRKRSTGAEEMLVALMLEGGQFVKKVKEELSADDFKDPSAKDVVKAIFDMSELGKEINPAKLINHMNNDGASAILISEAVNLSEMKGDKEKALSDCISRVKNDNVKSRLEELRAKIKEAHDSSDEEILKSLMAEYGSLIKNNKV